MKRKELIISVFVNWLVIPLLVAVLLGQFSLTASAFGKKNDANGETKVVAKNPIVEMDTTKGVIKIEIFQEDAPITSNNFLDLVGRGFYNGVVFHRYEPGFCIQGGDPTGTGRSGFIDPATKRERTIRLEVSPKLRHSQAGMIAMARTDDPNSASSQFYFTLGPASNLDGQYAVFGKVIAGLDVVKELRRGDKMNEVFVLTKARSK